MITGQGGGQGEAPQPGGSRPGISGPTGLGGYWIRDGEGRGGAAGGGAAGEGGFSQE